ncbi:hypothetical protein TEA_002278 [Camellia sinensis var. sinensis]|uniref:Cytochrome c oxidase copper chaperone n=1 Tax=Camellia sinensis var. sinensis TaxID=542762 RepID=A0A4S4ESI7_CAMSN|nr:hypothetical protein TEA_002278 [Camellia sinensis var. sinensis]
MVACQFKPFFSLKHCQGHQKTRGPPSPASGADYDTKERLFACPDTKKLRDECIVLVRIMVGLPVQNPSSASALSGSSKDQGPTITASGADMKPKKKMCCACPDTKKLRDECIVEHGEAACSKWIDAHLKCLRAEGFNV